MREGVSLFTLDAADLFHLLEQYYINQLAEENERPALAKVREHVQATFHPQSDAMRSFEHGDEEDRITPPELTEFDPDAAFPFEGLDAPLGG